MAPIYDSDIAEERWTADVWKTYELWEKVERRFKRKRRLWITAAAVAFVLLSSIPVIRDSLPKWRSLGAARSLASALSRARLRSAREQQAVRLGVAAVDGGVVYRMELVPSCDAAAPGTPFEEGRLFDGGLEREFTFLPVDVARQHEIPGIVTTYCHDPFKGGVAEAPDRLHAFALLPVNDLAETRFDRMSMVLVDPISGAVSID